MAPESFIRDLTCPEDIRRLTIDVLKAVPFLADLAYLIDGEDLAGTAVWDAVDSLRDDVKCDDSLLPLPAREARDLVELIVCELVGYNNCAWNFGPGDAPKKINWFQTQAAIQAVLWARRDPELCAPRFFAGPDNTVLVVWQSAAHAWRLTVYVPGLDGISDSFDWKASSSAIALKGVEKIQSGELRLDNTLAAKDRLIKK